GGFVSHEPVPVGSYLNGADRYSVVAGLIPSSTAVVSTIALNVEPGWRRADDAKLTWFRGVPGLTSVIARIAPFAGLVATHAAAGSLGEEGVRLIACSASRGDRGSLVA